MRPSHPMFGVALLWSAVAAPSVVAQNTFASPQPPCGLKPKNYLVQSATVYLHLAGDPKYLDQRPKNLRDAHRVLVQALTTGAQGQNPAAWYYLGRYYAEVDDPGGDSAFTRAAALAPECREDIDGYRQRLWRGVLNNGFRSWQEGKDDSAIGFFKTAFALAPENPRSLFPLGAIYLNRQEDDSAAAYLRRGAELAAGDTALARDRRNAFNSIGQLHLGRAMPDSFVQQWPRTRNLRDSVERAISADSITLGRMQVDAAARRARGANLAPAGQRAFSRDSAGRAQSLAQGRTARADLAGKVARDSGAAQTALEPAIRAYRDFLAAYPGDGGSISRLATLYAMSGRATEADRLFDSLFAATPEIDGGVVLEVGRRFVQGNLLAAANRALTLGVAKSPYHRNGLFDLAAVSLAQRDTAQSLATAQRLVAIDPLNRSSLRLLAAAWELRGRQDSVRKYRALADTALPLEIAVIGLQTDSSGFTLTVAALNLRSVAAQPFRVTFEFLDPAGAVQETRTADYPALPAGTSHQVDIRVTARGLLGWRYHAP